MDFQICKATPSDYRAITTLIGEVLRTMEQKEWFAADNADYTYDMLSSGKGTAYLARDTKTGEIAGIFMTTYPGDSEENLGTDLGFSHEQLLLCAHMDTAAVLPKYRGHQLQYRLMQTAEADLRALGYRYLLCTIHPDNAYSKHNALRQGYQVMKTTLKYGGYLRNILMKELI